MLGRSDGGDEPGVSVNALIVVDMKQSPRRT